MNPLTPPKATLGAFIEDNSKLVTSIAAFIALTAFSTQIDSSSDIKFLFPGLSFFAAALLSFELLMNFPDPPRHWRLELFSSTIAFLTIAMGWYWFSQFPVLWVPLAAYFVYMCLFLGAAALLTYLFTRILTLGFAKLFKRTVRPDVMHRISRTGFLVCVLIIFAGLMWTSHKLPSQPNQGTHSNLPAKATPFR